MKKLLSIVAVMLFAAGFIGYCAVNQGNVTYSLNERSGCCSHHSGVCGCSGGRAKCCDGTLSPSCGCRADSSFEQRCERISSLR